MTAGVGRVGAIVGPFLGGAGWSASALPTRGVSTPSPSWRPIGAVCIALVNRDPAPDEPLPLTEDEADHIGLRH